MPLRNTAMFWISLRSAGVCAGAPIGMTLNVSGSAESGRQKISAAANSRATPGSR